MTEKIFLACFVKNGKVTELIYCYGEEEVETMAAVARSRGCEIETFLLAEINEEESVNTDLPTKPEIKTKKTWNKFVKCVETDQIFQSVRDCSEKTGIPYMTITNCIKNKNATRGFHFVLCEVEDCEALVNNRKGKELPNYRKKILCTTTGELFDSVTQVFEHYPHIPLNSFYYNMRRNKPVKGLMFEYV